jgi:cell division protein ZapA
MQAMVPINILIGDRSYRIKVNPSDEETVRKVTSIINEKVIEFKTHFSGKDMQDYIAMVLIWYATQQPDFSSKEIIEKEMKDLLDSYERTIDKMLKTE